MTDRRYTGQRMEGIGLYDYGARWYDASLGRFTSADTIVPNMGDPQAWDRYAYVDNNPVKFIDPTGHCATQYSGECYHNKSLDKLPYNLSQRDLPDYLADPSNVPEIGKHGEPITQWYASMRSGLYSKYGFKYVSQITGKITDQAFLALIISAEFGGLQDPGGQNNEAYAASVAGLSSQYHTVVTQGPTSNTTCYGSCSFSEQVKWLNDMAAIFNNSDAKLGDYNRFEPSLNDASKVINKDVTQRPNGVWWFWGNPGTSKNPSESGRVTFNTTFGPYYVNFFTGIPWP